MHLALRSDRLAWDTDLKNWQTAQEYARNIASYVTEYVNNLRQTSGLSLDERNSLNQGGQTAAQYITSLRQSIDLHRQNADAIAESSIQMAVATGQMSRLDAAQAMAALHTQQYKDALQQLQDQRTAVTSSRQYENDPLGRKTALQTINNQIVSLNGARALQAQQDQASVNPQSSSAFVGFTDALDQFVLATRDAAGQMREITANTLGTLNDQFVRGISGQRTDFGDAGASIFRNIAGIGLQKAEGLILGAFGFGSATKPDGSASNPLYVRIANAVSSTASSIGSAITGKSGGFLSGLMGLLPHFASGGPVSAGTLAVVGEQGPEPVLFGSDARVIPHGQASTLFGSGGHTFNFNVDASGSSDPAMTQAAVQRGILAATPHIIAASHQLTRQDRRRTPSTKQ